MALEDDYVARLQQRVGEFQQRKPAEYEAIRDKVLAELNVSMPMRYRITGLPAIMQAMVDEAVVEAVRREKGWPNLHQWLELQRSVAHAS